MSEDTKIIEAEQRLDSLQEKPSALHARHPELRRERDEIAFEAIRQATKRSANGCWH